MIVRRLNYFVDVDKFYERGSCGFPLIKLSQFNLGWYSCKGFGWYWQRLHHPKPLPIEDYLIWIAAGLLHMRLGKGVRCILKACT